MKLKSLLLALGAAALAAAPFAASAATSCIVSGDPETAATEGAVSAASEASAVNAGTPFLWTVWIPVEARIFTWDVSGSCSYDFSNPGGLFIIR